MSNDTAQERSAELLRLLKRDGAIKPSKLIEEARDPENVFHNSFEWDDTVAGREYRLIQARKIIKITPVSSISGAKEALIHVPSKNPSGSGNSEGEYLPRSVVVSSPDKFRLAVQAVRSRYESLGEALNDLLDTPPTASKTGSGKAA